MVTYSHHVSGFFGHRKEAESTLSSLLARGLPVERLHIFDASSTLPSDAKQKDSNAVLKHVLVDGSIGTAVGTGIGALAQLALVAADVSLFIASPLLAPLAMLGWGASLGGLIGAVVGAEAEASVGHKDGWFSDLVRDAITSGQSVLVVQTRTPQETDIAREVIQASVGQYKELSTV
jgi:hypothetical protein